MATTLKLELTVYLKMNDGRIATPGEVFEGMLDEMPPEIRAEFLKDRGRLKVLRDAKGNLAKKSVKATEIEESKIKPNESKPAPPVKAKKPIEPVSDETTKTLITPAKKSKDAAKKSGTADQKKAARPKLAKKKTTAKKSGTADQKKPTLKKKK